MKTQIRIFNVSLSTPRNTRPCAAKCENCDSDWVPFQVNFDVFFESQNYANGAAKSYALKSGSQMTTPIFDTELI